MSYGKGFEGSKYVAGRSRKEIASLIRQDIKAGIKSGDLPKGLKCSIRCSGSSIDCDIVGLPAGFPVWNEAVGGGHRCESAWDPKFSELRNKLRALVQAYRYDDSDAMTDYFDTNFYGGYFDLSWKFERSLRDRKSLTA